MLFTKSKTSPEQRILQELKNSKGFGCYNHHLAKQTVGGLDWRKRISNLRKDGYNIIHVQVSKTTHKYYLIKDTPLES